MGATLDFRSTMGYAVSAYAHIGLDMIEMRELARIFHALSDETRLRIFGLLLERECCVCEVMQALEVSQTRASRNLNILYDAGLLRQRKEGLWSFYAVDREGMRERFAGLVQAVERSLEGDPMVAQDRERLRAATRVGPGCVRPECGKPRAGTRESLRVAPGS